MATLIGVLVSVLSGFFLLPTGIAIGRGHNQLVFIFLINFFLGASVIGWIIAFFWSLSDDVA